MMIDPPIETTTEAIMKKSNNNSNNNPNNFCVQPDASNTRVNNQPGNSYPLPDQIGNYQRNIGLPNNKFKESKVYIIGSGIAGLSAAYYFIRDGKIPASNITFLEQLSITGGSMDGQGNATDGYMVRGGREMDFTYENLWDMFQDIPALEMPEGYSVLDEYRLINDADSNYSIARLIHNQGEVKDFSKFGLKKKDQLAIMHLLLKRKEDLDDLTIEDYFSQDFLDSNFWTFWRTMFAFENWHSLLECKLYMHRFLHALDGLNDMSSLAFPKYNQYDTYIIPLRNHLTALGVNIQFDTIVTDLDINEDASKTVTNIIATQNGTDINIPIRQDDFVIVTTGSMTEDTRYGDSNTAPNLGFERSSNNAIGQSQGWQIWNNLAKKSPIFGNPTKFNSHVDKSSWMSATLTCKPSALVDKLKTLSVNDPYSGKTVTGGIITITDSNWLMSFTCNRQPHFPNQPSDTLVVWVYALFMDKTGNVVHKTMPKCTGNEIVTELCHHLGLTDKLDDILSNTITRTAYMPYITSMFMPRAMGDRPEVVPAGCKNLGLVGQFVETHNDVVFTMETSVRTSRIAVYKLLGINKQVPDIAPLQYDIRHMLKGASALNDGEPIMGAGVLRKLLKGTYYEHILPELQKTESTSEQASLLSNLTEHWEQLKNLWHKQ